MRIKSRNTSARNNWTTSSSVWEEIFSWTSRGDWISPSEILNDKIVLEATRFDGSSTAYLKKHKKRFSFRDVFECDNFFEFALKNRSKFQAVLTNPPWDHFFLEVFYKFLLFLEKPFVLILRSNATRANFFIKVFGTQSKRTIIH